ncbi:MAG: hypothetical protein ACOX7P_09555 [Oscillospiraceae bacterium]
MLRFFSLQAGRDRRGLLNHVNDERLSFPAFFVIMKELHKLGSFSELRPRNLAALRICSDKISIPGWKSAVQIDNTQVHEALLWMFNTGKHWEGPSRGRDDFDMLIDYIASMLVVTYDDRTVLRDIADIIFRRNRKGQFIHDLVWAFFQTLDKESPALIAERLLSGNSRDVELACKLLHLDPPESITGAAKKRKYDEYITWLNENRPYLYLTGEHFQQMENPKHFDIDMEAKYLGKEISPRFKTPVERLTREEVECLESFRSASSHEREMLADYSCKLRSRDMNQWRDWIRKDIARQVMSARAGDEVV